ncbi:class I SAM-dependent methyltransferase [Sphingobacterium sp. N143]|uniref:class I SAM-dependent methyltransferase n=1 Tax=Sphingobacterium sp. N143 TaxID=2746727 RepID=UPI0025750F3B|nr:class I SAM-dependent methyltransferase [Sphingobacterium sp. N143]MDM1293018.1 class I SAM-dependent methyltransferase [Sphingobacterium sp. N143]
MQENKYDDVEFFKEYEKMYRSQKGLLGAGEWPAFQQLLPDFKGKDVLDLGCGFGWHCRYAIENGANSVIGTDISKRMLKKARKINPSPGIVYQQKAMEELVYQNEQFDIILSSLAFHYIADFAQICNNIFHWLKPNGHFIFSVEHPIFTARHEQDWIYAKNGNKLHWPIDHYFTIEKKETKFLGNTVTKYHRTLTAYFNTVLQAGFTIKACIEPQPTADMLAVFPEMRDELRRPMMLIISATK